MAQQILNNGISASVFRQILNENFSDLYNNTPTKNHASATTDFGVATTNVFGHIRVTTGNGLNLNNLEQEAKEQLGMQKLNSKQTIYMTLPKNDYIEPAAEEVIIE